MNFSLIFGLFLLVLIPCLHHFTKMKSLVNHELFAVKFGFLIIVYINIHLFNDVILKRTAFFIYCCYFLFTKMNYIKTYFFKILRLDSSIKIPILFLSFALFVKIIPGGYLPPFWGGIAGWSFKSTPTDSVTLSGLKLVNNNGEDEWLSNGFTVPQSFMYRQYLHFKSSSKELKIYLNYLMSLYKENWSLTERGLFPYQRYLGEFALPGHMPGRMMDYRKFDPSIISKIVYTTEIWSKTNKNLVDKKVHFSFDINSSELEFYE